MRCAHCQPLSCLRHLGFAVPSSPGGAPKVTGAFPDARSAPKLTPIFGQTAREAGREGFGALLA